MKKLLLLAAAGLILQATPAFADDHKGRGDGPRENMFEKHDANGDGMVSEAEFMAHAKAKFVEKDTNKDGSISKDEAQAAKEKMKGKWKEKREDRKEKRSEKESAE